MDLVNKTERAKQYLLGTLSDADKTRFEEDYFEDDELFEEIEIAEGELADAFVRNELSANDRKKFETSLINFPRLAQRVEFARTLTKSISKAPSSAPVENTKTGTEEPLWRRVLFPKSSWLRFALAAYILLFVLGGGALFLAWMRLRAESTRLTSERAELQQQKQTLAVENEKEKSELTTQLADVRAENARLLQQLESASKGEQPSTFLDRIVAVVLSPGFRSTGGANIVNISRQTTYVRLRLTLDSSGYSQYSAAIKTAEQTLVWSKSQLKPRRDGKAVELLVPASQLPPGSYLVEVSGLQNSAISERLPDYSFQVVRKRN